MNKEPFVYVATSLTHVPQDQRFRVAELVAQLQSSTRFLKWAFDIESWKPETVENVCSFDLALATELADFVAGVYFSPDGSDGRGVELYERAKTVGNKGMQIYIKSGVRISRFITDMVDKFGLNPPKYFDTNRELGEMIIADAFNNSAPASWRHERNELAERLCDPGAYARFAALL